MFVDCWKKIQPNSFNSFCSILATDLENMLSRKTRLKFQNAIKLGSHELTFNLQYQDRSKLFSAIISNTIWSRTLQKYLNLHYYLFFADGPLPSTLQEVSVPVINNTVCEGMYRIAGFIEHIPHIFICAGWPKGGFDSCEVIDSSI